jgi:hypothetical protein
MNAEMFRSFLKSILVQDSWRIGLLTLEIHCFFNPAIIIERINACETTIISPWMERLAFHR